MLVYKGKDVIDAHETAVEHYLRKGWSLEKPTQKNKTSKVKKTDSPVESLSNQNSSK